MAMLDRLKLLLLFVTLPALAQTNQLAPVSPPAPQNPPAAQSISQIRADCIQNRRVVCGKVLKILPEGLVVDSGYTNLMRPPLNLSWVAPGTVTSARATNVVESRQPGSVCMGLVFLANLPKKPVPKLYDYVNLVAYPCGEYSYTSVGDVHRTVRKFSAKLANSVQWRVDELEKQNASLK